MDNDAFKDLIRKQANVGSSSSKEIARKAVEEEFRKKKKRKRGGGYGSSSSDEDDDDDDGDRKSKKNKNRDDEDDSDDEDNAKAIQEDLAARYRDRAKERREGGADATNDKAEEKKSMQNDFLIVPHNKKGLDLSLVRKERKTIKPSSTKDDSPEFEIRKEMPSTEEAFEILKNYADNSLSSSSVKLSRGVAGYIRSFVEWETDTVHGRYDRVKCGTAGKTLQNTKLAFAIDGHPSDTAKAWEIPRQFTLSDGDGAGNSASFSGSSAMLTSEVVEQVTRVFDKRQRMLSQMKQQQANAASTGKKTKSAQSSSDATAKDKVEPAKSDQYDDHDDDIFGGLDDYVPPVPKKKS